jgi:hypothetical protein
MNNKQIRSIKLLILMAFVALFISACTGASSETAPETATIVLVTRAVASDTPTATEPATANAATREASLFGCSGIVSIIQSYEFAEVRVLNSTLTVRATPNDDSLFIGIVESGAFVKLVSDTPPQCIDSTIWWQIIWGNQLGWVAEVEGTTFYLAPRVAELAQGDMRTPGQFQLEGYCEALGHVGYDYDREVDALFCQGQNRSNETRRNQYQLRQTDYNQICDTIFPEQEAVAIRSELADEFAAQWRCYVLIEVSS